MTENEENPEKNLSLKKKILLLSYLVFMLFLNIFDFLNLLSGDIDFIEKLLSWSLFGYIFYEASLTQIFIGTRKKTYDLLYIFAFALMSITKSLVYYTEKIFYIPENYHIFRGFLDLIQVLDTTDVTISFFIGLIFTIIISIMLLRKNEVNENSLLGSIKFNEFSKFLKLNYLTLILISIFFGMIVFNFFMEWFALAIDDFIPILGLIYYLFKYLHLHTKTKISSYLSDVNNSGQDFFENVLKSFSNKNTLLIGISFLLTLHLLVDCGVYIFPYVTGISNGLYFGALNSGVHQHIPLFNFYDFGNSQISKDIGNLFMLNFGVMIVYLVCIITIFSLLVLPFYIYYKNIQKEKVEIHKTFGTLFLAGLIFMPVIIFFPNINMPINIGFPENANILGVDIYTKSVITESFTSQNSLELLSVTLLFLVIIGFLLFRYEKYKIFFDKLIYVVVIIFFLTYISIFFISVIGNEYSYIKNSFEKTINVDTSKEYSNIYNTVYMENKYFVDTRANMHNLIIENTQISYQQIPFTTLEKIDDNHINYSENQNYSYYLLVKVENPSNEDFIIDDISKAYFKEKQQIKGNVIKSNNEKLEFIYELNKDSFQISNSGNGYIVKTKEINFLKKKNPEIKIIMNSIIEYTKFVFLSIFYIFGSLEFATYFIRKNILDVN